MRLLKLKEIQGEIKTVTGLHIGASTDTIEIGGMDNPIIKHPVLEEPYIPGSSLKGKMRSIMEWIEGRVVETGGDPCKCGTCKICRVFGAASSTDENVTGKGVTRSITRLIVRDAFLNEQWKKNMLNENKPLIEEKWENVINRITAKATPRQIERVVPGAVFNFSMLYQIIDLNNDGGKYDEGNFYDIVLKAIIYLEKNYLGGGGSRGNGQIKFEGIEIITEEIETRKKSKNKFKNTEELEQFINSRIKE